MLIGNSDAPHNRANITSIQSKHLTMFTCNGSYSSTLLESAIWAALGPKTLLTQPSSMKPQNSRPPDKGAEGAGAETKCVITASATPPAVAGENKNSNACRSNRHTPPSRQK